MSAPLQVCQDRIVYRSHMTNKEYLGKMLKRTLQLVSEANCSTLDVKRKLQEIEQEMLSGERNSQIPRFRAGFRKAKQPKE
jgi:hypothetical protein